MMAHSEPIRAGATENPCGPGVQSKGGRGLWVNGAERTVWRETLKLVEKKQASREKGCSEPMGRWDLSPKDVTPQEAADVAQCRASRGCRHTINDRRRLLSMKLL